MGSSGLLLCSSALCLVLLGSASLDMSDHTDQMMEQREITFDLETIMQEMQKPDSDLMPRELDLSDLVNLKDFVRDPLPESSHSSRVRVPAAPRSFPSPYHVRFPLARPSSDNLHAICVHSAHRPRYPPTYFPASGYGQQKRRAAAVNNAEFWFSECCLQNATRGSETTLCCATQAWEHHITAFCEDDVSVKDRIYQCCRKQGSDRLDCFHNDAPNPSYDPTEEQPVSPVAAATEFSFEPSTCQRPVGTQHSFRERSSKHKEKKRKQPPSSQKASINFPLGRPTADNVGSLCKNLKLRPLYSVKCLAGPHYKLLARQAKSINRIEKGFKQCCRKRQGVLDCVEQKWREELNMFCEKQSGKKGEVHCCSQDLAADDRFKCFQDASPDPHYNVTPANEELTLKKICDVHKLFKKKIPVALPVKTIMNQCCPLSEEPRTVCFEQRMKETSTDTCSSKKYTSSAIRRCCRTATDDIPGCLFKLVMDAVAKVAHKGKRKRCPLQS